MADDPADPPRPAAGPHGAHPKARTPSEVRAARKSFVPKLLIDILPKAQRDALPEEAQELFVQAYNYGLEEYDDAKHALHLAWASVERHFDQVGGHWVAKPEPPTQPGLTSEGLTNTIAERLRKLHNR